MGRGRGFAAAGALLLIALGRAASAQVCETSCSRYEEGQCVEYTETCTTPPPPESYGAIAYGRSSRAWGYSYQWDSREKAEQVALQNCGQHGDDCEIMVWFDRKCGAVAAGAEGTDAYWGLEDTDSGARSRALAECEKDGTQGCEIEVSQCSR
jgi:serine/threonine-protein kinase